MRCVGWVYFGMENNEVRQLIWILPGLWQTILSKHWGRDKMAAILQMTLSHAFLNENEYWLTFHCSLFLGSNLQYSSIGSDNGLVSTRQQAIIWTNGVLFTDACHWFKELTHMHRNLHMQTDSSTWWHVYIDTVISEISTYSVKLQEVNQSNIQYNVVPSVALYLQQNIRCISCIFISFMAEARIFWENHINIMTADVLGPCVTRSSAAIVMTM